MRRIQVLITSLFAFVLTATACGSTTGDASPDAVVDDAEDGGAEADLDAAASLRLALTNSAATESYVITASQETLLDVPALGPRQLSEHDPDHPATITTVTPDGVHVFMDLYGVFGGMLPAGETVVVETWSLPEEVIVDTTTYQVLLDLNPSAPLGPFRPGVSRVDLARVGTEGSSLVEAIAGAQPPSLSDLAAALVAGLDGVQSSSDRRFTGTMSHAAFLESMGGDLETLARSTASGLALGFGFDVDTLTDFYVEVFRAVTAEVVITLSEVGLLEEVHVVSDLSVLYERLPAEIESLMAGQPTPAEVAEVERLFADAVFTMDQIVQFDLTPGIRLPDAPALTEDRTDEWIEFMVANGFVN